MSEKTAERAAYEAYGAYETALEQHQANPKTGPGANVVEHLRRQAILSEQKKPE